ncbi:cuticular protein RR-2 family member 44 [Nasonia vitripennis]|uniref:Uncharacterized protein n=1 Tax=Nasonia vitripennis TaxID=7425 RepID=A0A7M6UW04_NASVI|nr:cuticular protein RR-2 family member 44 [Nasonia vitripennis]
MVVDKITFKMFRYSICIILILIDKSTAGVISLDGVNKHQEHYELKNHLPEHHEMATSYMNFHGPVEGPEHEIKVPYIETHHHEHHEHEHYHEPEIKYVHDYVAHPKYEYSYGVEDHHTGDFHSQKETRDGSSVTGEYSIAEPGGRLRIVSYRADKDGFHAEVHTSGKNDHSSYYQKPQLPVHVSHHEAQATTIQGHYPHDLSGHYQHQFLQEYPGWYHAHGAGGY